jgi:hypothetical protein
MSFVIFFPNDVYMEEDLEKVIKPTFSFTNKN